MPPHIQCRRSTLLIVINEPTLETQVTSQGRQGGSGVQLGPGDNEPSNPAAQQAGHANGLPSGQGILGLDLQVLNPAGLPYSTPLAAIVSAWWASLLEAGVTRSNDTMGPDQTHELWMVDICVIRIDTSNRMIALTYIKFAFVPLISGYLVMIDADHLFVVDMEIVHEELGFTGFIGVPEGSTEWELD